MLRPLSPWSAVLVVVVPELLGDASQRLNFGRQRVFRVMQSGVDEEEQRPALVVAEVEPRHSGGRSLISVRRLAHLGHGTGSMPTMPQSRPRSAMRAPMSTSNCEGWFLGPSLGS
jgi:hypothetical protein